MGRPSKFTPATAKKIYAAVRAGNTREDAAALAGIARSTLSSWVTAGRRGDPEFVGFVAALKRAEAAACRAMVRVVRKAAIRQWQAAAWWLERRRPQRWAKRPDRITVVAHQGSQGLTRPLEQYSDEELQALVRDELTRRRAPPEGDT